MKRYPLLASTFVLCAAMLIAQTNTGQITGQVFDEMKAAVPGATVNVTQIDTNITQKFQTNSDGVYTSPSLQPGRYRISVEMKGFHTALVERVEVFTGRVSSADITLQLGAVSETITVGSQAPLLSQDTAMVASTVESVLIDDLPTSERSTLGVILLAPGVVSEPGLTVGSENPSAYTGYTAPNAATSVGGGIPGSASVLVDGAEVSSASLPRTGTTFSKDTAKEITIVTVGIPAQYGRTGGGVINQTTRSGSNLFHGGVGWAHTDPGLMARQHGAPTRPNKRQNFYNGALSGPVDIPKLYNGRDKTFFLVAIEPSRMYDVSWTPIRIPTPGELAGKLNDSFDLIDQNVLRLKGADAALAAPRTGAIYAQAPLNSDGFPYGNRYSNTNQYVPIPNNDLSAQLAKNPIAKKLFAMFPTTQNPGCCVIFMRPDGLWDNTGNNVWTARGVSIADNRYSFKLDHKISNNDRISGRFSTIPITGVRFNYWGLDSPVNGIPQDRIITRNATLNETHTFSSSSMVNEFRMAYTRVNTLRDPNPTAMSKDWGKEMGLTAATVGYGFPSFSGGALKDVGSGGGDGRVVDANFGAGDDLSILRGRHAIKMGIDTRAFQMNKFSDQSLMGGGYSYGTGWTNSGSSGGSPLASFILGYVESYSVKTMRLPFYYRWRYYAGYIQDDFKVRRNLTINIGVRYQVETPRYEKYSQQGSFIPDVQGQVPGLNGSFPVNGGFAFSSHNGRSQYLWPLNYMGFEPRFGLAWSPLKRTTIRASYAMLHAPLTGLGNQIVPDLNVPAISVGGTTGGVNAGVVNYITNPVGAIAPNSPYTGAPMFSGSATPLIYIDQTNAVPYIQQFSFAIQFQVARNTLVETGYMGTKGNHLINPNTDYNRASYATMAQLVRNHANFQASIPNTIGLVDNNNRIINTTLIGTIRPYPQYYNSTIPRTFDRRGNSFYNAFYVTMKQRMAAGLYLQATYTNSKAIDDATNPTAGNFFYGGTPVQNADNLKAERSLSSNDIPQRLVAGFSYELPVGKGKILHPRNTLVKILAAGWKTSGMYMVSAGAPFRVALGGNGYWFSQGGGDGIQGSTLRPDVVLGAPIINPDWRKDPYGAYIYPGAFSVPGSLDNPQFGNAPRTVPWARGPRYTVYDSSFFKSFRLYKERAYLDLRADVMGIFNHPGFLINPGTGHNLVGSYNRAALTNPSIDGFTPTADFGKLNQNNTLGARTAKISATIRF